MMFLRLYKFLGLVGFSFSKKEHKLIHFCNQIRGLKKIKD